MILVESERCFDVYPQLESELGAGLSSNPIRRPATSILFCHSAFWQYATRRDDIEPFPALVFVAALLYVRVAFQGVP